MTDDDILDTGAGIVTEGVAASAVAGGGRRRRSFFKSSTEDGACSNCGTILRGRICHSCGQDSDDFHRPVWSLVVDILDGLFSIDGRFWRTVPPLLYRPGHVTRHYLTGVRARYVQPFRLLIVASVVFFLVFFWSNGGFSGLSNGDNDALSDPAATEELLTELDLVVEDNPEAAEEIRAARDIIARVQEDVEATQNDPTLNALSDAERRERAKEQIRRYLLSEDYPDEAPPDMDEPLRIGEPGEAQMSLDIAGFRDLPIDARRFIVARAERIIDNPSSWTNAMQRWTPRLVFVLLPIYALMLAALHIWRRGFYLYDHLVVSLHFHAFLFLFLTILVLLSPVISISLASLIFIAWSNIYLYRLHRVVYEDGRLMSILRTIILDFLYLIILAISFVLLMVVGLLSA